MRLISTMLLLLLLGKPCNVFGHEFWVTGLTSRRHLSDISKVNDLKSTGVKMMMFYTDCPVDSAEKGKIAWKNDESRKQIMDCLAVCDKADIAAMPLLNLFYENDAPDRLQVSRWSGKPRFRCFSAPTDKLIARLEFFVGELSKYKSFTGICIDDEPGVLAGGCVCERCKRLFKEKYGIEPPSNDDFLNARPGIVPDDHPILLWNQFQRELSRKYYASLASAIQKKNPAISVFTIPAAPFSSGKQLSIPNCTPAVFAKSGRMVTLDACHIQEYQMYNQFYFSRITADGWNNRMANGLCLSMMGEESVPQFSNVPIYDAYQETSGARRVISPLAFKRFVLQTFSEGARGIVYFPADVLDHNFIAAGKDAFERYIQPVCQSLENLHRLPGKAGIFYSSTTRDFTDIWKENPIERYRHLHECDALAYYLFRKGVPFEIIMENEIGGKEDYSRFKIILASGVRFISARTAQFFKGYYDKGGQILCDPDSAKVIPGSKELSFKADSWYEAVKGIHPHSSDLEFQAGFLESALGQWLEKCLIPCNSSSRLVNVNYLTDGKDLYLFLVVDALDSKVETHMTFDREYDVTDVLEKKVLGRKKDMELIFSPGTLRVLRLKQ